MTTNIFRPQRFPEVSTRDLSSRIQPIAAVTLAIGLALAIFSEGSVPELWTKGLLGALIVPTIITAMWLTASKESPSSRTELDRRQA